MYSGFRRNIRQFEHRGTEIGLSLEQLIERKIELVHHVRQICRDVHPQEVLRPDVIALPAPLHRVPPPYLHAIQLCVVQPDLVPELVGLGELDGARSHGFGVNADVVADKKAFCFVMFADDLDGVLPVPVD